MRVHSHPMVTTSSKASTSHVHVLRVCVEAHDANDGCVRPAHAQNCNLREFLQNAIIRTRVARVSLNNPAGHCDMIPPAHA